MKHTLQFIPIALAALLLTACGDKESQGKQQQNEGGPPVFVTTAIAEARDLPRYLPSFGKTEAWQEVEIMPQVAGTLITKHIEDGQNVKAGDLLFTIDQRPYEAARDAAQGQVDYIKASLKLAEAELKRSRDLVKDKLISEQELERLESVVAQNKAQLNRAEAQLQTAQINFDYTTIKAPFSGAAGIIHVDEGDLLSAGMTHLVTLRQTTPVKITFTLPGRHLPEILKARNQGEVLIDVIPADQSDTSLLTGKLYAVDSSVNPATGSITLQGRIDNPGIRLWPGISVDVRLRLETLKDVVVVPEGAVRVGQQGEFVYTVGPDQKAGIAQVKAGQRYGDKIAILEGLEPGTTVVGQANFLIRPGATIIDAAKAQQQGGPPPEAGGKPEEAAPEPAPAS